MPFDIMHSQSEDSGVGSNLQVGGGHNAGTFFDVPPHFSVVPPHEGAQ